ncbi:MAG TPA: hypothetical protein VM243_10705 [Phycisphaerae bacterium]|nr:hypothetical protein [Phycisphaerae bacterium]
MTGLRVVVLLCAFGAVIPIAFLGCAAGLPANRDGIQDLPAPGEEGATCLADGTCGQGLECLANVCAGVEGNASTEGEEEDQDEAEGENENEDADEPESEGEGQVEEEGQNQAEGEGQGEGEGEEEGEGPDEGEGGGETEGDGEAESEGEGEGDEGDEEGEEESEGDDDGNTFVMFHNNSGPMCLEALDWLDGVKPEHPTLVVEEHLTYEAGEIELLLKLEAQFQTSQGVSTSFEYLPIVFYEGQAFSGFNDEIAEAMEDLMLSAASGSP